MTRVTITNCGPGNSPTIAVASMASKKFSSSIVPITPTGAVYESEEIAELVQVCREHKIVVISDEIYEEIDFSGRSKRGFCSLYPEGTLTTGGPEQGLFSGGVATRVFGHFRRPFWGLPQCPFRHD